MINTLQGCSDLFLRFLADAHKPCENYQNELNILSSISTFAKLSKMCHDKNTATIVCRHRFVWSNINRTKYCGFMIQLNFQLVRYECRYLWSIQFSFQSLFAYRKLSRYEIRKFHRIRMLIGKFSNLNCFWTQIMITIMGFEMYLPMPRDRIDQNVCFSERIIPFSMSHTYILKSISRNNNRIILHPSFLCTFPLSDYFLL